MGCHQKTGIAVCVVALVGLGLAVPALRGQTSIVSLGSSGQQGNDHSFSGRSSFDGRFVAFESHATNLVPGGTNGYWHVFLRDMQQGNTLLVDTSASGEEANDDSVHPDVTDDGVLVVFASLANNLVPGDTNNLRDIFVKNLSTGAITRVSVTSAGQQALNGHSQAPYISADGRFVVFRSLADNLVPGDTNWLEDVFLHDLQTGTTIRVNVSETGEQSNGETPSGVISRNGQYVGFHSEATNLLPGGSGCYDIYVKDVQSGQLERVSISSTGVVANDCSWYPSLSYDGTVVSFASRATNLVPGDLNGCSDVFVHDRQTGETSLVSVHTNGTQANNHSGRSEVSADGLIVTFGSSANNLVSGSFLSSWYYVYARNRATAETIMASLSVSGGQPNKRCGEGDRGIAMSGSGDYAVFDSIASNLVEGDTNESSDVFARALKWQCVPPTITLHPVGRTVCPGESVTFTVEAQGSPPLDYQWRKDGVNIPGATQKSYTIESVQASDAGDYTAAVTNACGTAISDVAALVVGVRITEQPVGAVKCVGTSFFLRVTAEGVQPITYQWRKDGVGLPGETQRVLSFSPLKPEHTGTYDVLVTSPCGTLTSDPATVTVQEPVRFLEQPEDQTACEGAAVTFSAVIEAQPPLTFYWRVNGVNIATPGPTYTVDPVTLADAGTYQLFVENTCGVFSSRTATLTVPPAPTIVTHPQSQTVCQGVTVVFTVEAQGGEPLSYQWRKDGENIPGATEPTYQIASVTLGDAGVYDAVVSNQCGEATSNPATLTVTNDSVPVIKEHPRGTTVCVGEDATFTVVAEGTNLEYQWEKWILQGKWSSVGGGTDGPVYALAVFDDGSGPALYAAGDFGTAGGAPVNSVARWDGQAWTPLGTGLNGPGYALIVYNDGSGPALYVGGAFHVAGGVAANYIARWSGAAWSALAAEPDGEVYAFTAYNDGGSTTLVAGGRFLNASGAPVNHVAKWNGTVWSALGAGTDDDVFALAAVDHGKGPRLYAGGVFLNAGGQAAKYIAQWDGSQWAPVGPEITDGSAVYALLSFNPGTGPALLAGGDFVRIGTQPVGHVALWNGSTWSAMGGGTLEAVTAFAVVSEPAGPTLYAGTEFSAGTLRAEVLRYEGSLWRSLTDGMNADVRTLAGFNDGTGTSLYAAGAFTVAGGAGVNHIGRWSGEGWVEIWGATQPMYTMKSVTIGDDRTQVRVRVSNPCKTVISNPAELRVDDGKITFVKQPQSQTACETTRVTFEVAVQATPPISYQWRKDGVELPGKTEHKLVLEPVTFNDAGVYDCVVETTCATATSNAATLTVIPFDPPVILQHPLSQNPCEGSPVTLSVEATSGQPLSYQWRKDWDPISGATQPIFTIAAFKLTDRGRYDVLVWNLCTTVTSDPAVLGVLRLPVITRQPTDRAVTPGEGVTLVVEAFGRPLQYQWYKYDEPIPGATQSTYTLAEVKPGDEGQYVVTVTNGCGTVVSKTVTLSLVPRPRMEIASVRMDGMQLAQQSEGLALSASGQYVAMVTQGNALLPGFPSDNYKHVYLRDRRSGTITMADAAQTGWLANDDSFYAVSEDGYFVLESAASNIVANDTNGVVDVFLLVDRAQGTYARISESVKGEQGNGPSGHPALAERAYHIVFQSDASNLVPDDTNGVSDIFAYDRQNKTLVRLSINSLGEQGNGPSRWPSISSGGRFVVFESEATNLVPDDTNGVADIFLHDRDPDGNGIFDEGNGVTIRLSVGHGGVEANGESRRPALAWDAEYVAFDSAATNLVEGDTNDAKDVFVQSIATVETWLVSRSDTGALGDGDSTLASIARDGGRIAFRSVATNLVPDDTNGKMDIFVHDRGSGLNSVFDEDGATTIRVSIETGGAQADAPSDWPMISIDGKLVVFQSDATNIAGYEPGSGKRDRNGCTDVFAHYIQARHTVRVSLDNAGQEGNGASRRPSIDSVNQYVCLASEADNLVAGDANEAADLFTRNIQLKQTELRSYGWVGNGNSYGGSFSADGRYFAFQSLATNIARGDNPAMDVFVRDAHTGVIELASVNAAGIPADDASYEPVLSADGRYVAFDSFAENLVPGAEGGLFFRDRQTGEVTLLSVSYTGQPSYGHSASMSADGRYVAFLSLESDLVPDDTNGCRDAFVRDRQTSATVRVSVATSGQEANKESVWARISADGRYVVFTSFASNLVPDDDNNQSDVFVHDLQTRETKLVSATPTGHVGDDGSAGGALTADGRLITFYSGAKDLVPYDENQRVDVFVRDMQAGEMVLVSVDDLGAAGNHDSSRALVSADGRYIAFTSKADNLTKGHQWDYEDVFVADWDGCRPPLVTEHPIGGTITVGQKFTLSVTNLGTRPWRYQWRKDGVDIPGATSPTFTIESALPSDAGAYDVAVSNECGTTYSAPAIIKVEECTPFCEFASLSAPVMSWGDPSRRPTLSATGRHVAYWQTGIYGYDRLTERVVPLTVKKKNGSLAPARSPSLSADGRFLAFWSESPDILPGYFGIFLLDRDPDQNGTFDEGNGLVTCISLNAAGQPVWGHAPVISADARFVAFISSEVGPTSDYQVYVHDRQTGQTSCVSQNDQGQYANQDCTMPGLSADGRYVVFVTSAGNLDPRKAGEMYRAVYRHDRLIRKTELVSLDWNAKWKDGEHTMPSISADGQVVALMSQAALVPEDTNNKADIYVRDMRTGQNTRVSVHSNGTQANGNSVCSTISADGNRVAFYSYATNLVTGDENGYKDAFVHDRARHETRLVSVSSTGEQGNENSGYNNERDGIAISADGAFVGFVSRASNLATGDRGTAEDVFLRDLDRNLTTLASVNGGAPTRGGCKYSSTSGDDRFVAFESDGSDLVPGDTNNAIDVFLRDRLAGEIRRINLSPKGQQAPSGTQSGEARLSADGRYVAFYSSAENLVSNDKNGRTDVFAYDVATGRNVLISLSSTGEQGNGDSGVGGAYDRNVAISATGRFVAFASRASNLVLDDTNGKMDIFVRDRDPDENGIFDEGNGVTTRVSVSSAGLQASSWSVNPAISADGRYVAFDSPASNLVSGDTNNASDVFVHDRSTATTTRVSINSAGEEGNADSLRPTLSGDGQLVAFISAATNLDPLDPKSNYDVFVRNRVAGQTSLASLSSSSVPSNGQSDNPGLSADGRWVVFDSSATNLVPGDTNGVVDVFVRDLQTATTIRASVSIHGEQADKDCTYPAITDNGSGAVFQSRSQMLVPGIFNPGTNVLYNHRAGCFEPDFVRQPTDLNVPEGGRAVFSTVATGYPPPTYQWHKDGTPIFGATYRTYVIERVTKLDEGTYDVVISNHLGSRTSNPVRLGVLKPGDLNCDGKVNFDDIDPFVLALSGQAAYQAQYPNCNWYNADCNGDGQVDFNDIDPFVALLTRLSAGNARPITPAGSAPTWGVAGCSRGVVVGLRLLTRSGEGSCSVRFVPAAGSVPAVAWRRTVELGWFESCAAPEPRTRRERQPCSWAVVSVVFLSRDLSSAGRRSARATWSPRSGGESGRFLRGPSSAERS